MKHLYRYLPVALLACAACACSPRLHSFWAGNYNIRVYTDYDLGDKHWNTRKDKVFAMLRHYDVCGLEEVTDLQAAEFIGAMEAQDYRYIGYGRDNGLLEGEGSKGEQTGLVYRRSRFECSRHGRFFLSTTPDEPSKLDSSAYTRLVVWARLKDLKSGREFYFFATHLDHPITATGIRTRTRQAAIAIDQIRSIAGDLPFVLSGDLNCEPSEPAYALFAAQWQDAFLCADTLIGSGYEPLNPETGARMCGHHAPLRAPGGLPGGARGRRHADPGRQPRRAFQPASLGRRL